ncbi:surfactin synthase thioesterase subunit [Streptosporangium becharense]|uniref:Surfactin synthase thioesterase subunit n=1 Tax=Streptosporangium becharense TaxID=1816182 RepID=A0A7W9IAU2_9ACTN|nr:alpha/beta fold hydrolase [Streptosporangium becharense]MBB2914118.1 surfactin synthase thioesterase subunit [Streptosporangium becharense]MBB5817145.1 surfactin synthase thioesterase subunit [Streptosporangium becharense]
MHGPQSQALNGDRRWLKRFGRPAPGGVQLLCFHSGGAGAGMFRHWTQLAAPGIDIVAVQLPGRADRFGEPPYRRMKPLLDDLITAAGPLFARPFALYGTSMGARVAWALAHALRERALPRPRALYVAASAAPCLDDGTWSWEDREDGLEGYVREMGGTPAEVLAEPQLLAVLLGTLDADLTVLSTHGFRPATPLDLPIHAFAGSQDPEAPPDRMIGWKAETTARFDLTPIPGGHFFDREGDRLVIETIGSDLGTGRGQP